MGVFLTKKIIPDMIYLSTSLNGILHIPKKINTHTPCTTKYANRSHHKGGTPKQIHELVILKKTDQSAVDQR